MRQTRQFSLGLMLLPAALMLAGAGCGNSSSSSAPAPSAGRTFNSGGIYPEGIGVDAADHIWVANRHSNNVAELSINGDILTTIIVGSGPHGLKIDRGNTESFRVQNTASNDVTAIGSDGSVIGTYVTGGTEPQHAQFDGDGYILVTNQGSNTVAEIDSSGAIVQQVAVGQNPHAISRDSSGTITVLDSGGAVVTTITNAGYQPSGNATDPSENLWQSIVSLNQVAQFAAAPGFTPIASYATGIAPRGVMIDKAGSVFVANQRTNEVLKYDTSGAVIAHYKVGAGPENMAIDSRGDLWISDACGNTVTRLQRIAVLSTSGDGDSNG
jgi:streptogramin lyase